MPAESIAETRIAVFRAKRIRKVIYQNEWWFSVVDVVEALTGTDRPRKYWSDLKAKLSKEGYSELSEKIGQLKLAAFDGKMRLTDQWQEHGVRQAREYEILTAE